jgi:hypothetical protein
VLILIGNVTGSAFSDHLTGDGGDPATGRRRMGGEARRSPP